MVIQYSSRFEDELQSLYEYISKDSHTRAKEFISQIINQIDNLAIFPLMGRAIKEDERELIFKGYVIPYLIDANTILILGIYKANLWK